MAQPDWTRGDLSHNLRVLMVDPLNLSTIRGELSNVEVDGQLNLDYYSDTRMSATISTVGDDGWDGTAALRLVHEVHDYTGPLWTETLGTFYVPPDGLTWEWENEETKRSQYSLVSTLYGLKTNKISTDSMTIGKGATALGVMRTAFSKTSRPYTILGGAKDSSYSQAVAIERSSDYLTVVMDACEKANDTLSVDANGKATVSAYVAPSSKAASWSDNPNNPNTLVIGPISGGDAGLAVPERVTVAATNGKESVIGKATQPAGHRSSHARRGFCIDDYITDATVSPFTNAQATKLAERYLKEQSQLVETLHHGLRYRPLREGDIEALTWPGTTTRRWQVASASLDFSTWTWELDLKGGWR